MLAVKALGFMLLVALFGYVAVPSLILSLCGALLRYDVGLYRWSGLLPALVGLALVLHTGYSFVRRGKGTTAPFDPPRVLVVNGLNSRMRNPLYVGAVAIMVGESVVLQSLALLIYAVILAVFFHLFVILYEEPGLQKRFGQAYTEYRRRVPRWIPRLRG